MARPGLTKNRKFKRLARALEPVLPNFGTLLARGVLEALWEPAYEAGDDLLGDAQDVEGFVDWKGPPGVLFKALLDAGGEGDPGFIEELPNRPGRYRVHDLWDHAPEYVRKRRQRENERKSKGAELRAHAGNRRTVSGQRPDSDSTAEGQRRPKSDTPAPAPAPIQIQTTYPGTETAPAPTEPLRVQQPPSHRTAPPDEVEAFRVALARRAAVDPAWFRYAAPEKVAETRTALLVEIRRLGQDRAVAAAFERYASEKRRKPRYLSYLLGALQDALALPTEPDDQVPTTASPEWNAVRDTLREEVRPDLFRRWLAPLDAETVGKVVRLTAPDAFHAAFVRDNYAPFLAEALNGSGLRVEVQPT